MPNATAPIEFGLEDDDDDDDLEHGRTVQDPAHRLQHLVQLIVGGAIFGLGSAIVLPLTDTVRGQSLAAEMNMGIVLTLHAIMVWRRSRGIREDARKRLFEVDVLRGAVLQHIISFHVAWDFSYANLISTCSHTLPYQRKLEDYFRFLAVIVFGHAIVIWIGRAGHILLAEMLFALLSWVIVTTWKYWASRFGMALMMFVAGYVSMVKYERLARTSRLSFMKSVLWHTLLLSSVASLLTVATYWKNQHSYMCNGAVHLLALGSIVHLPFLLAPRCAIIIGPALSILASTGHLTEWRGCGSFDHQPFIFGIGAQIFGVGAARFHIAQPLAWLLAHRSKDITFAWSGQRSFLIYLAHQPVVIPLIYGLYTILTALGAKRGRALFCDKASYVNISSILQLVNASRQDLLTPNGFNKTMVMA